MHAEFLQSQREQQTGVMPVPGDFAADRGRNLQLPGLDGVEERSIIPTVTRTTEVPEPVLRNEAQ